LEVDQNGQVDKDADGDDELPDLDGSDEFGNNAGDVDFHGAEEVVAEMRCLVLLELKILLKLGV
jgi:hypothetical protein